MSENTMKLGHLPVLTWNRLKLNSGSTENVPMEGVTVLHGGFDNLPAGVTHTVLSSAEAADYIGQYAVKQPEEAVVAGKTPVYHPQAFATGLGAEFEDYLGRLECGADLVQVQPGMLALVPVIWGAMPSKNERAVTGQIIHLGKGAQLTLIQLVIPRERLAGGAADHFGGEEEDNGRFFGMMTRIILEEGAHLHLVNVQILGSDSVFLYDAGSSQGKDSGLKVTSLQLGGREVFNGIHADLSGEGAEFDDHTGYMAFLDHKLDMTVTCTQRGPATKSGIIYDGILSGTAKKDLKYTIDFRKGSKGASGNERENVLMLSEEAENRSMPVILCEEEDMDGRHGATIGRPDKETLFYMQSRGISKEAAVRMLTKARIDAVAQRIQEPKIAELIGHFTEEAFENGSVTFTVS
ncbi:MAG: SufD family Fe-S cluster assembly protein [Lachnospiraceae bacterium]|nr:SufD family Fe-S cluster assembly protein [Lachnospiraceae bacterium]